MAHLNNIELTIIIGRYARDWHLPDHARQPLTKTITDWEQFWPHIVPAPHPSPRNNRWLKRNPWFEATVLPMLKQRIQDLRLRRDYV